MKARTHPAEKICKGSYFIRTNCYQPPLMTVNLSSDIHGLLQRRLNVTVGGGYFWYGDPDPQKDLNIRSPRTIGEII